jgi:hypothetical protein
VYANLLERHGFERIETGQLVDTYARSKFEDTRRKAQKFGARGTTLKAFRPSERADGTARLDKAVAADG